MSSRRNLHAFIFLILSYPFAILQAQDNFLFFCQGSIANYTSYSMYGDNLVAALNSLSINVDQSGFYNVSVGNRPDQATALVFCRGDIQLDACTSCARNSTLRLVHMCPTQRQAVLNLEYCSSRYWNNDFYIPSASRIEFRWNYNGGTLSNTKNSTNPSMFMADLRTLLNDLRGQVSSGDYLWKVASGNRSTISFQTIYALVQCTPDLSPDDCTACLDAAARELPICCDSKIGARVQFLSCNLRYEIFPFVNETRLRELVTVTNPRIAPTPPVYGPVAHNNNSTTRTIIIVVVSTVAGLVLFAVFAGLLLRKRRQNSKEDVKSVKEDISITESLQYDFVTIRNATNEFSDAYKLGQGGFGSVYKGILSNGQTIAVKRLATHSGQGDLEFKNEVLLLAKLQHKNLVRLLGFSIEGTEKLLVYEFVENASLDLFLFDRTKRPYLDWAKRCKIIMGIAKGILYLHEDSRLRIIHRDLKPSNVLLDREMNPKIADFGIARLCVPEETQGSTSRIVGTHGYMSPEYVIHGQFSVKSDVYSFGVLLLEIITGQKNSFFRNGENVENLLSITWENWRKGKVNNSIDPLLMRSSVISHDISRCIHIGLLCVQENAVDRPTMANVVLMLNSSSITLQVPSEPAFFVPSESDPEVQSGESSKNNTQTTQVRAR